VVNLTPENIEELQRMVVESEKILPKGGGTKLPLSAPVEGCDTLDMTGISGMVTYDPAEFTFTALAGTRLADIRTQLEEHSQYLPFDPLLVQHSSTLGGMVASGLSGSGSYRYGGMRDFILAVEFINCHGQLVRGGARVVKNSAGFDLPKLMVGSLGVLGALVEVTFKVFPRPAFLTTVGREFIHLEEALECLWGFSNCQLDVYSLDLEVQAAGYILMARIGASATTLHTRAELLHKFIGGGEIVQGEGEAAYWENIAELGWVPPGWHLIKIPLTPSRIPLVEAMLTNLPAGEGTIRRYLSGGQQAWLAIPEIPSRLSSWLTDNDLSGLVVLGEASANHLGVIWGEGFARRVKAALDPLERFTGIRHAA
jgi:glycolate oxidase FAD binding subunit